MKTIVIITTAIALSVAPLMAQDATPQPPQPPKTTTVSVHSDKDSKSSSYSYRSDDDQKRNGNTSISVSNSDDNYSFTAKHSGAKDQEIKDLITKEMGTKNLVQKNGKYIWAVNSGNDEVYEIEWRKGRLSMEVDKTIAGTELIEKIANIGVSAKTIITGKSEADRSIEREQREVERKLREVDRMRREAERLRRRAERDADRIKQEAERLGVDTKRAINDVRKKGGMSKTVESLLKEARTTYDGTQKNNNWVWPAAQSALERELLNDKLITTVEQINLTKDIGGIYVNGSQLESRQMVKYIRLLMDHDITANFQFNFNKSYGHIVIINENAQIENFFRRLKQEGLIDSLSKKLKLEINGNSIYKNGEELSSQQLSQFNLLMHRFKIIPAPGKIIEIVSEGSYKLGYSLGSKSHIGTWIMGK